MISKLSHARIVGMRDELEKIAIVGAIGKGLWGAAKGLGSHAWKSSVKTMGPVMGPLALGLGVVGAGSAIKSGIEKSRAYRAGFDPRVQQYQSEPIQ